jgi:two-component system, sensor histidine kinase and response regulator
MASAAGKGASWRVLIVDDHAGYRELARTLFEALGCEVRLAPTGRDAAQIASASGFDLVLLDRGAMGCGGDEAARRLRQPDSASQQALIVSHSTNPPEGHWLAIYDRVILKPISASQIIGLLEECSRRLHREQGRRR